MAFDSPGCFVMDGTTVDAEVIRRAIGTLIGPAGGVVTPGDLAVTQQSSPNMSVQISTGQIWVPGTSTATQGPYYSRNGASITETISTSSPSFPRVDTVIAQVEDVAYAGANKDFKSNVVMGTPTAGATLVNLTGVGAVPASSLVLAYVLVPTSATSIVTADIANVAAVASRATGLWVPLTLASGCTGSPAGDYAPSGRLEGDVVRLKGAIQNNSGSSIFQVATVPAALRPSGTAVSVAGSLNATPTSVAIAGGSGNLLSGSIVTNTSIVWLDGATYTLS